ncbi:hypothetical protein FYK55_00480 [Roseiconus nitratireducens]|uniref:Uncharacterized protein n=1 Tax=Roseiconus nitratireducens TaxID=2605748 RepID=A0A5M6DND2_9BACT|nr:hypothetical protein [Roseiconus nitratireducens]KAA5546935.1 hypothetical protein FYK55_00480 [Roseiconus nitratireducens]
MLILTAFVASALAALKLSPVFGLVLCAMIPGCVVTTASNLPARRPWLAALLAGLLPVYILASGPLLALAELLYQNTSGKSTWGFWLHRAIFPDVVFWNPDFLVGRRLIMYVHWWYELAGG